MIYENYSLQFWYAAFPISIVLATASCLLLCYKKNLGAVVAKDE